jgi:hypothetical protein
MAARKHDKKEENSNETHSITYWICNRAKIKTKDRNVFIRNRTTISTRTTTSR